MLKTDKIQKILGITHFKMVHLLAAAGAVLAGIIFAAAPARAEDHILTAYQAYDLDIYDGDINHPFEMMGTKYTYGVAPGNWTKDRDAYYFLDQEFSSVSFLVGAYGTHDAAGELRIYLDGELADTYPLSPEMTTKSYEINTQGVTVLRFRFHGNDSLFYALANVTGVGGHVWDYDKRVLSINPTSSEAGEYTDTCRICGVTRTEAVPSKAVCKPELIPYSTSDLEYWHEFENAAGKAHPSSWKIMGRTWKTGLFTNNWTKKRTALFALNQNYRTVSFKVGHEDGASSNPAQLSIYKDEAGTPFQIIELWAGMPSEEIVLDTTGITQLKLEITAEDGGNFYAIYDFDYEWMDAKAHDFELTSETEATSSTNGIKVYTCKDCGFVENRLVPKGISITAIVDPEDAADDGTWTCVNGHTGNTGNFCPVCGAAKPADDGTWTCVNGHSGNTGQFCPVCGAAKP